MEIIADLQIHSKYARATSKNINIENLEKYARIKGINILGTGDFTHPVWIKELKNKLIEDETGILKTKSGFNFLFQTEISNIYTQDGKQRRIHNILLAPNFETVEQIIEKLSKKGRLDYDGRPIFGFNCVELIELLKGINEHIEIIPAHVWTPWYNNNSRNICIGMDDKQGTILAKLWSFRGSYFSTRIFKFLCKKQCYARAFSYFLSSVFCSCSEQSLYSLRISL